MALSASSPAVPTAAVAEDAKPPEGTPGIGPADRERRERNLLKVAVLVLIGAYELCFGRFFPNINGNLGHDYAYVLPDLLAGDYWFRANGPFAVPWFTPAFCGGRPYYADPQSMYYSLAQWLSFVMDPLTAVHASLLLFAVAGLAGMYRLARDLCGASREAALLAGAVFMFNGFYAVRMIVGHYTFHSLMLVPLLAWLLTCSSAPRISAPASSARDTWYGLLAALVLAYMLNSGLGSLMVVGLLAALGLVAVVGLQATQALSPRRVAARLTVAIAGALVVSAAHLVASLSLLGNFPRSDYLLPGFADLWSALGILLKALFLAPGDIAELAAAQLLNVQWVLGRHEFEYGVTLLPLLALLFLAYQRLRGGPARIGALAARPSARLWGAFLLLVLAVPLAFNVYDRDWNVLLKQLPLIGSSSTFVRWFFIYIPVLALVMAPAIDALPLGSRRRVAAGAGMVLLALNLSHDFSAYHAEPYPVRHIREGYAELTRSGQVPPVKALGEYRARNGEPLSPVFRNDALTHGVSQLLCYYPTFGYGLEHLPVRDMKIGNVDELLGGTHFNLKNPACYVFPAANQCTPGDHFLSAQRESALRFAAYRDWPFQVSAAQQLAEAVSVAGLVLLPLGILVPWLGRRRGN
ncbi:MAG: hypothetical protein KGI67_11820 [Pseudomonadota bacterium]|nr:hypothetical protein [Pseudomonadota bacterium]